MIEVKICSYNVSLARKWLVLCRSFFVEFLDYFPLTFHQCNFKLPNLALFPAFTYIQNVLNTIFGFSTGFSKLACLIKGIFSRNISRKWTNQGMPFVCCVTTSHPCIFTAIARDSMIGPPEKSNTKLRNHIKYGKYWICTHFVHWTKKIYISFKLNNFVFIYASLSCKLSILKGLLKGFKVKKLRSFGASPLDPH